MKAKNAPIIGLIIVAAYGALLYFLLFSVALFYVGIFVILLLSVVTLNAALQLMDRFKLFRARLLKEQAPYDHLATETGTGINSVH